MKMEQSTPGTASMSDLLHRQAKEHEPISLTPTPYITINGSSLTNIQTNLLKGILEYTHDTNTGLMRFMFNEKIKEIIQLMDELT